MIDLKSAFQEIAAPGRIALAVGAVAVGGLLIYGSIPSEVEQPALGTLAQAEDAPAAPASAPAPVDPKVRAAAVAAKNNIDVAAAWTRATAGSATSADIFLQITSDKDGDKLLDVEAPTAGGVELGEAGAQKTGPLAAIEIPAGGMVEFAPGGRYFRLTGLKAPLKEGDSFLITLRFDKAGAESAAVRILAPNATGIPPLTTRRGDTTQDVTNR
jgi:copper(I)-binding protein